jgi:hypothetical protein
MHYLGAVVTNMTIARQQFGKHIPEVTQSTVEGPTLLGSKLLGKFCSNGRNTDNNRRTVQDGGLSSVCPKSWKRVHLWMHSDSFIRELSVQLWSVNQWTT